MDAQEAVDSLHYRLLTMEDDMFQRFRPCLVLIMLGLLAASGEAAPIRVTIVGDRDIFPGARNYSLVQDGIMGQKLLPDDFPAQGFAFGWTTSYNSGFYQWGGHAGLTFIFDRLASGPPAEASPSVTIKAGLDGQILGPPYNHYPFGQLSLDTIETSLANWSTDSDIPYSVIDAFLNPQDLRMGASASGSYVISASFWLPPVPVPEPTTYIAWGLVVVGAHMSRRRRHPIGDVGGQAPQ